MILLDTNQVMISNLFGMKGKGLGDGEVTLDDVRHSVLKGILYYNSRFKKEYGRLVLCYDSGNYWRTDQFPHYKASRKKKNKKDKINWNKIYELFRSVRKEIESSFPFMTMYVETVEADDIISVLVSEFHSKDIGLRQDKTVIVSADKDFQQLQRIEGIYQYSPNVKDFITCEDPIEFLVDHIIRGDSSDGIPNILSDDDVLVNEEKKQTIMSPKRYNTVLEEVKTRKIMKEGSEYRRNWFRNKNLIDLECIPKDKKKMISDAYSKASALQHIQNNNQMEYLVSNRLGDLTEFLI